MFKFTWILAGAFLLAISATSAFAADVTLTAGDGFGLSSFNSAGNWNNAAAPTAGNDYFTGNFILRTPADGGSYVFAGDSLTVNNTTNGLTDPQGLFYKGTGTTGVITIDNLILNGGKVSHGSSALDRFTLDGSINVVSDSFLHARQGPINVLADISGTATITNPGADLTASILTFSSPDSTFTGNLVNNGRFTLAENAVFNFDIGASGNNNAISGTGASAIFNGIFNFDLSGASSNPGDSWTVANVANRTYGATFSVGGGFNQVGSVWTNNTYTFFPGTGILSVSAPPVEWLNDADGLFTVGANWAGGNAPTNGDDAVFGPVITQNRTVTLDQSRSLNKVSFNNAGDGDYFIAPESNQVLTLVNQGVVEAAAGRHWLSVEVAGVSGLTKQGPGELILDHANSFNGTLTVDTGRLSVTHPNAIPAGRNVELTATTSNLLFGGDNGFFVENGSTGGATWAELLAALSRAPDRSLLATGQRRPGPAPTPTPAPRRLKGRTRCSL